MDDEQKRLAEELFFNDKKERSFAKNLYFGRFDSTKVFPYPIGREDKDYLNFSKQVANFVETHIDADWIDRHAEIPYEVISGLGKLGVLGMTIPKKYGGLGMSQYAYCKTAELVARRCASTALFINAHQSVGLKALLLFGTENQRERWLTPLARGEQLAAFSLTEPNAGSDASGIETTAVWNPEKNCYRINGKKQWTTNGSIAQVLTVMAKTKIETSEGEKEKITAFLVTPDMPGFKVSNPSLEKVGMRGSKTANLEFCDVDVPVENILGPIGGGLKVCLTVLDYGRTTFGATCTGSAKILLEYAIKHAKTRYQFKRPLASFGLVKQKIAGMAALTFAMDAATYFTAGMIDSGVEDIMLESAILKVFTSEAQWSILYDTMQIYGGRSFFTDHPLERIMRDSRLNMIGEGSNDVLRVFIAVVGLRDVGSELQAFLKALKNPIIEWSNFKNLSSNLMSRLRVPKISVHSAKLQNEASQLAKAVRRFGYSVIRLLAHYREEIIEKQLELERIANAVISIYTAATVISKLDYLLSDAKSGFLEEDINSGKLYCRMAMENIDRQLNMLFSDRDEAVESLSDQKTGILTK